VYRPLVTLGGGGLGRSCARSLSVKGVTAPSHGATIGVAGTVVGRHSPGAVPPVKGRKDRREGAIVGPLLVNARRDLLTHAYPVNSPEAAGRHLGREAFQEEFRGVPLTRLSQAMLRIV
jgi:hypothetical protein